jgi:DsbC/DsbD-like thiol-disulfide interchange protein/cytochrome c biogenesis protein CcdA
MKFFITTLWFIACSSSVLLASNHSTDYGVGNAVRDDKVVARLIAEHQSIAAGESMWLGLKLQHDPHWHTYWRNPGDSGLATTIQWLDLPDGVEIGPLQWPAPQALEFFDLVNYGYEETVVLPLRIHLSKDYVFNDSDALSLSARVDWLMCEDVCVPAGGNLQITLLHGTNGAPTAFNQVINEALLQVPKVVEGVVAKVWQQQARYYVKLDLSASRLRMPIGKLQYFSIDARIEPSAKQVIVHHEDDLWIELTRSEFGPDADASLFQGVLVAVDEPFTLPGEAPFIAIEFTADWQQGSPPSIPVAVSAKSFSALGLWGLLLGGFIGGLILNLMPCVFPVLGLKIMGFVNQAGEDQRRVVFHGLVFTLGVLISFWLLAGVLIFLRAAGAELGWGFQLQSPGFVYLLAALLLAFGLNLSGVFEIGTSAIGVGQQLTARKGYSGSFYSGVLATVVATPCAAPFLAPALGGALALPPLSSVLVFTFIALGLAFPYLLLSTFPRMLKVLPRPGAWMETFKQFMAFLLYATVAYLLWVLVGQLEAQTQLSALLGLVVLALACWVYGRWGAFSRPRRTRILATLLSLALLAGSLLMGLQRQDSDLIFETWSPERVSALRAEGRPVYIDFTARWCATCQVNKRVVFGNAAVVRFFIENDVAVLVADWTNQDPAITRALAEYERSAVPFNLIWLPNKDEPIILPELLTPGLVLNAFKP